MNIKNHGICTKNTGYISLSTVHRRPELRRGHRAGRGSTLIAVSSSGCTKVVTESAALAKKGGANVIALSDYRVSPLARCADLLLTTTTRTSPDPPDAELPLIQGQLTVIDMLYSLLSVRLGNEKFELTRNIVKPDKQL